MESYSISSVYPSFEEEGISHSPSWNPVFQRTRSISGGRVSSPGFFANVRMKSHQRFMESYCSIKIRSFPVISYMAQGTSTAESPQPATPSSSLFPYAFPCARIA